MTQSSVIIILVIIIDYLFTCSQGMDSVKRQTGQHLEFDPEWEGAFTIQIKLEDLLVLFTDWCSADRYLLVEGYKATLEVRQIKHKSSN